MSVGSFIIKLIFLKERFLVVCRKEAFGWGFRLTHIKWRGKWNLSNCDFDCLCLWTAMYTCHYFIFLVMWYSSAGNTAWGAEKRNYLRLRLIKICRSMDNRYIIMVSSCKLYYMLMLHMIKGFHTAHTKPPLVYKCNTFYLWKHFILYFWGS